MSYLTLTVILRKSHFSGQVNPPASYPYVSVSPYAAQHPDVKPLYFSLLLLIRAVTSA